jgi:hypothetical protein
MASLVGAREQSRRNRWAERLGGIKIHYECAWRSPPTKQALLFARRHPAVAAELFEIVQVGDFDQAYLVALGGGLVEL